jgi:hypothetical protein
MASIEELLVGLDWQFGVVHGQPQAMSTASTVQIDVWHASGAGVSGRRARACVHLRGSPRVWTGDQRPHV